MLFGLEHLPHSDLGRLAVQHRYALVGHWREHPLGRRRRCGLDRFPVRRRGADRIHGVGHSAQAKSIDARELHDRLQRYGSGWPLRTPADIGAAQIAIRDEVQGKLSVFTQCQGVKSLNGHDYGYRLRVGNYRAFFDFNGQVK